MSSLVILPDDPVPGTWRRSRLFSRAILRTSGEERRRSPVSVSAVSVSISAAAAAGAGAAAGALGWALAAAAPPLTPITATTVLIWTVVPACTLISESTPAAGEGISASTLSVEISNSGSSCCTVSPGFFSHLVMVPSKIDSPIWGMITSVAETAAGCTGAAGAGELVALGGSTALAGVLAAGASTAAGGAAAAGWPSASPMTPTTVLIWTVFPSANFTSVSTPLAGDGISASTLSVEISNRGSSRCTVSPGFLSHLVMVPSKIDSPIWGMITSVGMDSLSQRELLILEQSCGRCVGGRSQIIQRLDPYHLPPEDAAKVPCHRVCHLLERRRRLEIHLCFDAGDTAVADTTGHNQCEVVQIGTYVEGKAVGGDSAAHVNPYRGNLLLRDSAPGDGPDAGTPRRALGEDAIIRAGANQHLFQPTQVLHDAQRRGESPQIENRITHQLSRAVIGDVSSAVGFKQWDAAPCEQLTAGNHVLRMGIAAQGEHWRMFDQQEHVSDILLLAQ